MSASLPDACPQCGHNTATMDPTNRFCPQCRFPLMLVANKYRLLSLLSEGGFGNVYIAHHIHLIEDSSRVIKVIRPEVMNQPGMETRFFREVRVTASLSQKNEHIVRIYDDFGEEPQLGYYYVMEHLEGQSLYHLMTEPFDVQQALHIFDQLCEAISEAHRNAVVHRDLKPDNLILLQKRQYPDFVKVLDFGIAKPLKGTIQTRLTQGALGTPFYMSPEQCLAKDIGPESDLYAMGVILYEMLAGKLPFDFDEDAELFAILHAHITQPPRPLLELRPDIPPGLAEIVHKALAKKPEGRFASVEELRQATALFIDEDTPYKALTSSSRLRALRPSSNHTPSLEQSSPFPFGGGVSPTPPPGTRSAPIPAIVHADAPVAAPVPVGTGAPSGGAPLPDPDDESYPGAGTREWSRDDKVAPHPSQAGSQPPASRALASGTIASPVQFEDAATMPSELDPRLSQIGLPSAPKKKSKAPLFVALILLLGLAGGGAWYYFTYMAQPTDKPTQPLARATTDPRGTHPMDPRPGSHSPGAMDAGVVPPDAIGAPIAPPPTKQPKVRTPRRKPKARRPKPRRRRYRPRRRRPPRRRIRRRKPPRRRIRPRVEPRRRKPPQIVVTPRRRPPGRVVAMVPRPRSNNDAALKAYNLTGQTLSRLFRSRSAHRRQFQLARQLLKQYKALSPAQKQLSTTHLYQSVAYIRLINLSRKRLKRLKWMRNMYQTQTAEYKRVMSIYGRYARLAGRLYQYPKSRYYLCAFFYTGEAKERMHHLLEDAVHAPLPPPGFRQQMLSPGTLYRQARRFRNQAISTYKKGINYSRSHSNAKSCLGIIQRGLRRLRRF